MTGEDKEFIRVKEVITNELNVGNITDVDGVGNSNITFNAPLRMAEGKDIVFLTNTGTKIGTATNQKLGFWGKTPIVQAVLATSASNSDIVTALQNLGLVRQS